MQQKSLYTVIYWDGGYAVGKWRQTIAITEWNKAKEIYDKVTRMGYVARIISKDELDQNGLSNPPKKWEFDFIGSETS